ncbi:MULTISPECIES: hypothetical protein [Okeania]|uniref:hypothetical protein n=1 Tax=Okeania TaxID=1458928 RepID=UPI00195FC492|nr:MULTISPECIES: hypothetical protein [Okeania]
MMEYNPIPTFNSGTPETAGNEIVEPFLQFGKPLIEAFLHQTKETMLKIKK